MPIIRIRKTAKPWEKVEANDSNEMYFYQAIATRFENGDCLIWDDKLGLEVRRLVPEEAFEDTGDGKLEYVNLFFNGMVSTKRRNIGVKRIKLNPAMADKAFHLDLVEQQGFALERSTVFPGECYTLRFVEELPED